MEKSKSGEKHSFNGRYQLTQISAQSNRMCLTNHRRFRSTKAGLSIEMDNMDLKEVSSNKSLVEDKRIQLVSKKILAKDSYRLRTMGDYGLHPMTT